MIIIFTYNRPDMLRRLLGEMEGRDLVIIDDGSDYPEAEFSGYDYRRFPHGGKQNYWRQWQRAFNITQVVHQDRFIFMPDDWYGYDLDRIDWIQEKLEKKLYAFNIANKGVEAQWTGVKAKPWDIYGFPCYRVGFVDCCFATNRRTLEKLSFYMKPIEKYRFAQPGMSSGVGKQLSQRMMRRRIPMYKPKTSLCKEDPHESLMNPQERKRNPRPMI